MKQTQEEPPLGWALTIWYMLSTAVMTSGIMIALVFNDMWAMIALPIGIVMVVATLPFLTSDDTSSNTTGNGGNHK